MSRCRRVCVRASVSLCGILFKRTLKMSPSSIPSKESRVVLRQASSLMCRTGSFMLLTFLSYTLCVKLYSFASYAASLETKFKTFANCLHYFKTFKFCRSFFVGNCIFQYFVDKVLFSIEKHLKCNFFLNLIESSDISTTHLPFSDVKENCLLIFIFYQILFNVDIKIIAIFLQGFPI